MKKFAIIGMGFIYNRHAEAITDIGGEIVMTCDINPDRKGDFTNYRDMLASPRMKEVDCIVICTPNHLHPEMVRDALRTGKSVLCEKPLCINTDFSFMEGVNTVQQLHYHPLFNQMKEKMKSAKHVKATIKAYRDQEFWNSWKGDERKSGGVVYILGAHIFDLLISTLGTDYIILNSCDTMRKSTGLLQFGDTKVDYSLEFLDSRTGQSREISIDGEPFQLSIKDNLSFEGLHDKVYKAMIEGKGLGLDHTIPSIRLMDEIKGGGR